MNYELAYLQKLEAIIISMGGTVPPMTTPTSFERRSIELLDAIALSAGGGSSLPVVGSPLLLPYPVTLSAGLWTDTNNVLWFAPNGASVGAVGSGSTVAIAKAEKLFTALWAHLGAATPGWTIQTSAGGASSAGASAAADWAALKRLVIPDQRGRSLLASGQGPSLTNRLVGSQGGAETHSLAAAENAAHGHGVNDPGHGHGATISRTQAGSGYDGAAVPSNGAFVGPQSYPVNSNWTGVSLQSQGSGTPHNNMQPWAAYTVLWSLGERA